MSTLIKNIYTLTYAGSERHSISLKNYIRFIRYKFNIMKSLLYRDQLRILSFNIDCDD